MAHLDEKIPFLKNYIKSLKENISSPQKSKRKSIFSKASTKQTQQKARSYSADKLKKKKALVEFSNEVVGDQKNAVFKIFQQDESNYEVSLFVLGTMIEQTTISSTDVILMSYNKQKTIEVFKGIQFDVNEFYDLLINK